jgi:hypothetical protein
MAEDSRRPAPATLSGASAEAAAYGRLADRGIDPELVIGSGSFGRITTAGLYSMLGVIAATEKAGQSPTYALARLALESGLPSEIADTLFLAYNQQSAEEAGHGDKVFGNAYYLMGGVAPNSDQSVVGDGSSELLAPGPDKKQNKKRLGGLAGVLGGIETVALNDVFPLLVSLCEGWDHPIARDLLSQIRDTVRPEEARHVLIWRYVFHQLIAPKGPAVIDMYFEAGNMGRRQVAGQELERKTFERMLGTTAPSTRQLLGKDRAV